MGNGESIGGNQTSQHFKLISVHFKEGALDSPSFRATTNHLDNQLDNIEKWFAAILSSVKKIPKYVEELQVYSSSFLDHLVPPFIQDGLIDQEYTVSALKTLLSSLRSSWNYALSALVVNKELVEDLNVFLSQHIKTYTEVRSRFDQVQKKYDMYLSLYVSTPKTKEENSVMDDAYQLYQVRREYLRASLDLIVEFTKLGNLLDERLISLSFIFLKARKNRMINDENFNESWYRMMRIHAWLVESKVANEKLGPDVQFARKQVEESFDKSQMPSRDINDYKSYLINNKNLADIDDDNTEKHGYLFMKTWTEKLQKPIWVKRWVFIKDGVLGMLVLSPSQTFVQETDKIGVILCNVKYTPNEDRRFCFEVATVDTTIVLQAESLIELKSWLKVFENEKKRISQFSGDNENLFNFASRRFPPSLSEFASSVNTVSDKNITSSKVTDASGKVIVSSKLSTHIENNERNFKEHVYFNVLQCKPPFTTANTRSSIIGYDLIYPSPIPSALTANVWGSVNWGIYYLHDVASSATKEDYEKHSSLSPMEYGGTFKHPDYYPSELVPADILMRALFETSIEKGEFCLMTFRSTWKPNSRQDLSGRCFVTQKSICFYMQALGFVALTRVDFEKIVAVDVDPKSDHDILKFHFMKSSLKVKLFIDEGKLINEKLTYLINNRASDNPKGLKETIADLMKIEHSYWESYNKKFDIIKTEVNQESKSFSYSNSLAPESFKLDYSFESQTVHDNIYRLPPKALFHVLFGSESHILFDTLLFKATSFVKQPWNSGKDGKAIRHFILNLSFGRRTEEEVSIEQKIENFVENKYYNVTHTLSKFLLPVGPSFWAKYRIVILGLEGDRSRLILYQKIDFSKKSMFNTFIQYFCKSCFFYSFKPLDEILTSTASSIRKHGPIVKAVKIFGKIQFTDRDFGAKKETIVKIKMGHLIYKIMISGLLFLIRSFIDFLHIIGTLLALFIKELRMNWVLIVLLLLSCFLNLCLIFRSSISYWTVHEATNLAQSLITTEPLRLQRAVYLKEIQDMLKVSPVNSTVVKSKNSLCYGKFEETSFVLNLERIPLFGEDYGDDATRDIAKSLRESFKEVGSKRHELLVQLKMLDQMEKDIASSEWKNWLMSEINQCEYIQNNIFPEIEKNNITKDIDIGIHNVVDFCNSCADAWSNLDIL